MKVGMRRTLLSVAALVIMMNIALEAATYQTKGLVLKVDRPGRSVLVSCDAIPGYMAAMAMPFSVRDAKELNGLAPGVQIDFSLVVEKTASWIEKIGVHSYENTEQDPLSAERLKVVAGAAGAPAPPEIKVGDRVPDFTLFDQNRKPVSLSALRGKVVALTFIYTTCALPDFCYRLSTNFSRLQKRFAGQMGRDLVLLTVTFDPVHDTPAVMAQYGKTWQADPKGWRLLSGPETDVGKVCRMFGVSFWPDDGLMIHSLHTLLIDRNGFLAVSLEGNKFSALQLGDLVQTLIAGQPAAAR